MIIYIGNMTDVNVEATTTTAITVSTSTWNLQDEITANIRLGVDSLCSKNDATTEDILRIYVDQISNMFVTEQVRSALTSDPFQHLKENIPQKYMDTIINRISVVSHHSVKTMDGYVRTEAVVSLSHPTDSYTPTVHTKNTTTNANNNKKRPRMHHSNTTTSTTTTSTSGDFNLHFTYTRSSMTSIHPCTVSYTIDVCNTSEQAPQPLLWVHVYAAGVVPSSHNTSHAININDIDDDDQWSDINDDGDNDGDEEPSVQQVSKNNVHEDTTGSTSAYVNASTDERTNSQINNQGENDGHGKNGNIVDRYEAGMDPDVVSILVSHLSSMTKNPSVKSNDFVSYGDITVFFLLMTFPFYEHEWDIVGFLLKAVFDSDDSADGSDKE